MLPPKKPKLKALQMKLKKTSPSHFLPIMLHVYLRSIKHQHTLKKLGTDFHTMIKNEEKSPINGSKIKR